MGIWGHFRSFLSHFYKFFAHFDKNKYKNEKLFVWNGIFQSKLNNWVVLIHQYSTLINFLVRIVSNYSSALFCFVSIHDIFSEWFWFILVDMLYRFDSATNRITKSTICPSLIAFLKLYSSCKLWRIWLKPIKKRL